MSKDAQVNAALRLCAAMLVVTFFLALTNEAFERIIDLETRIAALEAALDKLTGEK